jgi:N-glycosylase/DNA lyase
MTSRCELCLPVADYALDATMNSGQVFAWEHTRAGWTGVVRGRWVRLTATPEGLRAETALPQRDWAWLRHFLQSDVDLASVLATFPADDEQLQSAVTACRGLRLLRQDPWECLAGFILSSTKQIVQIRQIVRGLCQRYGEPVAVPAGVSEAAAFPTAQRLATLTEADLRACRMGFRAPYLLTAARRVASGEMNLAALGNLPLDAARDELLTLPGVGEKIADCVLLFAYGFPAAFPIDVWVRRALRDCYFRGRPVRPERLREFATRHFGSHAGYAQQYLFHHIRTGRR